MVVMLKFFSFLTVQPMLMFLFMQDLKELL